MDLGDIIGLVIFAIGIWIAFFSDTSKKTIKKGAVVIAIIVLLMIMFDFVRELIGNLFVGACLAAAPSAIIVSPLLLIDHKTKFLSKHNKNLILYICYAIIIVLVLIATIWLYIR